MVLNTPLAIEQGEDTDLNDTLRAWAADLDAVPLALKQAMRRRIRWTTRDTVCWAEPKCCRDKGHDGPCVCTSRQEGIKVIFGLPLTRYLQTQLYEEGA